MPEKDQCHKKGSNFRHFVSPTGGHFVNRQIGEGVEYQQYF